MMRVKFIETKDAYSVHMEINGVKLVSEDTYTIDELKEKGFAEV